MKTSHIIVLVIVVIFLFGSAKLPELARSLGQSARILKKEVRDLQEDSKPENPAGTPAAPGAGASGETTAPLSSVSPSAPSSDSSVSHTASEGVHSEGEAGSQLS